MHVVTVSAAATQQKCHYCPTFLLWFNEQNHKILGYQSSLITLDVGGVPCTPSSPPHFEFSERERVGYFQLKASPPQSRDAAAFRQTSKERRESPPR